MANSRLNNNSRKWWLLPENRQIKKRLNIGCGNRQKPMIDGWINLDIDKNCFPDIVRDIRHGLPFEDDYFDEVLASHVLEHIESENVFFMMREIHRVCKHGAIFNIVAPHWQDKGAFDIDHKCFITSRGLSIFTKIHADIAVQNNRNIVQNCFWEPIDCFDDLKGERHEEPQTYITLKCDKSEVRKI